MSSNKSNSVESKNTSTSTSKKKDSPLSDEDLKKVSGGLRRNPSPEGTDPCVSSF
jgi:hypothetical protein